MVSIASAQTCTPVSIGTDSTPNSASHGPAFGFYVQDSQTRMTWYPQNNTVTLKAPWIKVGPNSENGYVKVRAGYGGCTQSWDYNFFHNYQVYDAPGHAIYSSPTQESIVYTCGNTPACYFLFWDPLNALQPSNEIPVTAGHTYWVYDCAYADVIGIGTTPVYCGVLTVHVD
jgi:hypothetical protein